jgi:hypothetical protein
MRLIPLLAWLCAMSAGSVPYALASPGWGLGALMQGLAKVHSASANFTERESLQMLNAPLVTSGTLTYVAPDYVRKTTISPVPEDFILDHGQVALTGGTDHQTQILSMTADPRISGLVEGIRATLAGDLPTLDRLYTVEFTGGETNWQLLLTPKDAELRHFVKWILITGSENRIQAIDTASPNGDHSEMGVAEAVSDAK